MAVGAAIQAGIFQGDVKDVLLLDVNPLTLSIETLGAVATPMIPKNTTIPTSKTQVFSTAADNQPSVEVHVLQGERPMATDNKTLAKFILDGIPPATRGVPQVEVTFDINADGILEVSAKDKATGKSQSVKIEATTSLNKDEVEHFKNEAMEHAEEDKKKKELISAKNDAESVVYVAEKTLKENAEKISADKKEEVEKKVNNLKDIKDKNDINIILSATNELSAVLQKIGESLYNNKDDNKPGNSEEDKSN